MSRVRHVAVVGRDAAGWLAALGLRRALGRTGVAVTLVELPPARPANHVFSALPSIAGLNHVLGLGEGDVRARAAAIPVLGQRFTGWNGAESAFIHGYDGKRASVGEIDFLQFWIMARQQGMQVPFEAFSPAAAAAGQGRVPRADAEPESFADLPTGYHLDSRGYVGLAAAAALKLGVAHRPSGAVTVERAGDRIAAVVLEDGTRVEADLFVDASGPEALLLAGQPGAAFEDWSRWLPCDRLLVASAPRLDPAPSFANIAAFQAGWIGMFPLQDRTGVLAAYDSTLAGDEAMARIAGQAIGAPLGRVSVAPFRAGIQARPWIGNCVAVGEAALRLPPLDGVELHLIHLALTQLVSLFPGDAAAMPEAEGYNIVLHQQAAHIRDFQAAHYKCNGRVGEPYWDAARAAEVSPALAHRIEAFAARGLTPPYDDETFEAQSWVAILLGHGVMPRDYLPQVDETPREEAIGKFQGFLHAIAEEVKAMPSVAAALQRATAPPPSAAPQPRRTGLF